PQPPPPPPRRGPSPPAGHILPGAGGRRAGRTSGAASVRSARATAAEETTRAMFRRAKASHSDPDTVTGTLVETPDRADIMPVAQWPDGRNGNGVRGSRAPASALFAGVCRYYHDCFSADSRGGILTNVLDKNQAEYL